MATTPPLSESFAGICGGVKWEDWASLPCWDRMYCLVAEGIDGGNTLFGRWGAGFSVLCNYNKYTRSESMTRDQDCAVKYLHMKLLYCG